MAKAGEIKVPIRPEYMADIDPSAHIGEGTKIWPFATVREHAVIGERCVIGRGAYIDHDVIIGDDCHIQNGAQIFFPSQLGHDVFIGPNAVLTNDKHPRAGSTNWEPEGVFVANGASIGAGAVVLAGVEIGKKAMVGAGAVVVHDVEPDWTVVGNPAHNVYLKPGEEHLDQWHNTDD